MFTKKVFIALFALCTLGVASAQAVEEFWVGSINDGEGNYATNVQNLDWSSSGSGLAVGVGPVGTPLTIGTNFNFIYQSSLAALNDPLGEVVAFDGLGTAFEYTLVAKIPETVAGFVEVIPGVLSTAYFKTLENGYFKIYYDDSPNADVELGLGFEDGLLVAEGTIDANQFSSFTYNGDSGIGNGSTILVGSVTSVLPPFFVPANNIFEFRFEGTLNYPPLDSTTAGFFDGTEVDLSKDLLLKVDASNKFYSKEEVVGDCRVTAGGVKDDGVTVPCELKNNGTPNEKTCVVDEWDTWGGQAGAQPGVDGNWTHHHVVSPRKSFVFHSNDLFYIGCSDPGACVPAAANATNRQIDFSGIGSFNNQKGTFIPALPPGDLCFSVHLEDIGEPGPGGKWPSSTSPCTHCPGTPIEEGDCVDCTDYYEIKIFANAENDGQECTGDLVYVNGPGVAENCTAGEDPTRLGYFTRSGNVQMHPQNN